VEPAAFALPDDLLRPAPAPCERLHLWGDAWLMNFREHPDNLYNVLPIANSGVCEIVFTIYIREICMPRKVLITSRISHTSQKGMPTETFA
jgi:hypothetical protein